MSVAAVTPRSVQPNYARPWWWRWVFNREFTMVAVLVAVFWWSWRNIEFFDNPLTLYNLFRDTAPLLLIAMPLTMVIITGQIDLSVASVVGLSSVLFGLFHHDVGLSIPLAALVAVAAGAVCGSFNGFLVAYVGLPSLAVTIGTLALFRGIAVGVLGTTARTGFDQGWVDLLTQRIVGDWPYPRILIPIVALFIVSVLVLHFSSFGRGVYEIGLSEDAARFSGVNVERTKLLLFVFTGAVAGFAGVYYTLRYGSARGDNATGLELQVIAAVLLGGVSIFGGRGKLHGAIAGVLLIGVVAAAMRLQNRTVDVINIVIGTLLVLSVISTRLLVWAGRLNRRRAAAPPAGRPSAVPSPTNQPPGDSP